MTDLGTLGGPNSDAGWRPNDSGNAGGGAETGTLDPFAEDFCGYGTNLICLPFFWRNSAKKMTPLPTLGGNNAWAAGMNDRDAVVGVAENTTVEPTCAGTSQVLQFKPVIWIKGRVHQLPTFRAIRSGTPTRLTTGARPPAPRAIAQRIFMPCSGKTERRLTSAVSAARGNKVSTSTTGARWAVLAPARRCRLSRLLMGGTSWSTLARFPGTFQAPARA